MSRMALRATGGRMTRTKIEDYLSFVRAIRTPVARSAIRVIRV